jgi:hypothetical protein
MSTSSVAAYQNAGLNAQEMSAKIVAGGETAREGFQEIINGLLDIQDPVAQANAAIGLFGTPLEDLGTDKIPAFLESLNHMGSGMGDITGRANEVADQLGGSVTGGITSFWQSLQVAATKIGDVFLPVLTPLMDVLGWVGSAVGTAADAFAGLGSPIGIAAVALTGLVLFGPKVIAMLRSLATTALTTGRTVATAMGPLGLILGGVTLAIGLFAGGNEEAEARVEAHKAAVDGLVGSLDRVTGKLTDASDAIIAEDFGKVKDQFDDLKLSAGDAAAAAMKFDEDGGAALQAYRDKVADAAVASGRLATISGEAAGVVEALARKTG